MAVICAIIGVSPIDAPPEVWKYRSGHLSTKRNHHQELHLDSRHSEVWSYQHGLTSDGTSVQFLKHDDFVMMKLFESNYCQTEKIHAPEYHMMLWKNNEAHAGSFGSESNPNERHHGSVPTSASALIDLNANYNTIHRLSNEPGYDRNKIYNSDGHLFTGR